MEKEEVKKSSWINKLFSALDLNKNSTLTAEQANIISRYGIKATSFESVVKDEIKRVQDAIYSRLDYGAEKIINIPVPLDKRELFERVRKHFSEAGYKTFYVDKEKVKELGNNKYLFISWDLSEEELQQKEYDENEHLGMAG